MFGSGAPDSSSGKSSPSASKQIFAAREKENSVGLGFLIFMLHTYARRRHVRQARLELETDIGTVDESDNLKNLRASETRGPGALRAG